MKTEREQFEARFPVPLGVLFSPKAGEYAAVPPVTDDRVDAADAHNDRWETWQAAAKQYCVAYTLAWVESPGCHCGTLIPLRSMNLKICADCGKEHPWELAPGQQPLIGNNRADRRPAD